MRVNDKVVVITGASSGIGRATALAFAAKGAAVVLAARRREALEEAALECERRGGRALAVPTDVTDADAVQELARQAVARFGRVDVWVNCAAVTLFGPFGEVPLDEFRRVLDVNVMGYVHGARAALPHLRQRGEGVLVNVASIVGVVAQPYAHAYGMSKHAVRALGASLRQELRLDGVRGVKVCTVMPATIDTPLFQHAANHTGRRAVAMPPVYPAERVARAVVGLVRRPRREVVVGPMGRNLVVQSRLAPGLTERMMAVQVDRTHLSRKEPAPDTPGNLFRPDEGPGTVAGGWHGRRKTAVRRVLTAAAVVGTIAAARRVLR
ncbi:short-chain dehydrogenase [[Actinomadura] parvosata subsp. kistnae]|uniref:Short-chain dehydrogenase n=1 Tax=[Actinomadura] parvosata subsp. kistnae TaxID=1909395 RepID=A0A1V0AJB3_9ACTN|nr:SDR family oxidoreductase [Nonomuraea sp. ATCC 55076]AQZ70283.1 short-chain dehydrogenase [Nonomuraea sp. ATCC 55076]